MKTKLILNDFVNWLDDRGRLNYNSQYVPFITPEKLVKQYLYANKKRSLFALIMRKIDKSVNKWVNKHIFKIPF